MASESRTKADHLSLYRALQEDPYRFGFFAALRRIEAANPDKAKIGTSAKPADDPIRLGQEPSMAFAPSTLASFKCRTELPPRLEVLFFGLFGPNGPMPLHLTEYARGRIHNEGDETFARFVDLFHHRMLSFFYRAWAESRPVAHLDRPLEDRFSRRLGSLIGIGIDQLRGRDAMPDYAKLHFAGLMSNHTHNAEGLLAILRSYFHMPISIEQYVGTWFTIPENARLRLGETPATGALGVTTSLGARVWECQSKFRLIVGPLTMKDYQRMLPGGSSLHRLVALVRNYLGDEFDWDVQLILDRSEVKPATLGAFGQLGWTTWFEGALPQRDPDDLYLNPMQELL
jgi:type VI secretion system protein ImpH